jgi:hypothetical protein
MKKRRKNGDNFSKLFSQKQKEKKKKREKQLQDLQSVNTIFTRGACH